MSLQSTALVNRAMQAFEDEMNAGGGVGKWQLRADVLGNDLLTAPSGTIGASGNLAADFMTAAASRQIALGAALADSSNDNTTVVNSLFFRRFDDVVVEAAHVSMAYANSLAVALNQNISNANGLFRCTTAGTTAASGTGPTGTGTGISDGTAVFARVNNLVNSVSTPAFAEVVLSTNSLVAGGTVSVTSYTRTRA